MRTRVSLKRLPLAKSDSLINKIIKGRDELQTTGG